MDYEHGADVDTNDIMDAPLDGGFIDPRLRKMASHSSSYHRRQYRSVHPNIIARATVDTTLAVIPEEAFHKLTQKFPKAASHIVQVIVTRFQRVTLMTSHRYLGLTTELLRLEKLTNDSVSDEGAFWNLPGDFYLSGAMDRLRRKFPTEHGQDKRSSADAPSTTLDENNKGNRTASSMGNSNKPGLIQAIDIMNTSAATSFHSPANETLKQINAGSRASPPGGLIGSTSTDLQQRHQRQQQHYNSKISGDDDYSMEDDERLRISVMKCLSKSLGIKVAPEVSSPTSPDNKLPSFYSKGPHQRQQQRSNTYFDSHDTARNVYPMDLFSQTGMMDSGVSPTLEALGHYDDDNISTISSAYSDSRHHRSSSIYPEEITILFYPEGATLVREKEHFGGLFFVIDGLLEATMTPAEGEEGTNPILQGTKDTTSIRPIKHHPASSSTTSGDTSQSTKPQQHQQQEEEQVVASEAPAGRQTINKKKKSSKKQTKKPAFRIHPGGLAGYLGALTGHPSFVDIRAKQNTYVGYLPKKSVDRIVERNPKVMMKLAKQLVDSLSPLCKYSR